MEVGAGELVTLSAACTRGPVMARAEGGAGARTASPLPERCRLRVFWDARRQTGADLGKRLSKRLLQVGFAVDRLLVKKLKPAPAVCAIGRPNVEV
jgi:hypothetical protein